MKTVPIDEHTHQCAVIKWANDMAAFQPKKFWMLKWLYAVPNGGDRHRAVAAKLKAEGVKPGVPDLCLPYTKYKLLGYKPILGMDYWPGLFIEMKSKDTKGRLSLDQKEWIAYLSEQGYKVEVCWSANEAIKVLEGYIDDSLP